jgi:hypothetical protein
MLLKINGVKTALGVTYFPNDGTDKLKTDELFMNDLEISRHKNKTFVFEGKKNLSEHDFFLVYGFGETSNLDVFIMT